MEKYAGNSTVGSNGKLYIHPEGEAGFYGNQHVNTFRLNRIGRVLARFTGAMGLVISGIQLRQGYSQDKLNLELYGDTDWYHTAHAVGSVAGCYIGSYIGARAGGYLGNCVFSLPGAFVGYFIGGFGGGYFGDYIGGLFVDKIYGY